jgi:hypothetical protein
MWGAQRFEIWPSSWAIILILQIAVSARAAELKLQFAPPAQGAQPADAVMIKVIGSPPPDAELHVYGLVNHSHDHNFEKNQTVQIESLRGNDIAKPVVRVPVVNLSDLLQVSAVMTARDGSALCAPATISLGAMSAVQDAPSMLARLETGAGALLDRILNLYDSVRGTPTDPRQIFIAELVPGKAPSVQALSLERAQYRALALSSDGDRIAWIVEVPEGFELWTSKLSDLNPVRLAVSPVKILAPVFADQNTLLFIKGSALMIEDADRAEKPVEAQLPVTSVSQVYTAKRDGAGIAVILRAQRADTPGANLPYLAKIQADGSNAALVPLAEGPLFEAYGLFVEGSPFFFAGTEQGVEGIWSFDANSSSEATSVFEVDSPGLVALSANGRRLAFAGNQ